MFPISKVPIVTPMSPKDGRRWALLFLLVFVAPLVSIAVGNAMIDAHSRFRPVDIRTVRFYPLDRIPSVGETVVYWKFRREVTAQDRSYYDVAAVGDSSALMSFLPPAFNDASGMRSYNLGLDGAYSIDLQTDLLEFFIRNHGRPRLIVIHHSLASIGSGDALMAPNKTQLDRVREWLRSAKAAPTLAAPTKIKFELADTLRNLKTLSGEPVDASRNNPHLLQPRNQYPSDQDTMAELEKNAGFMRNLATAPGPGKVGNVRFPAFMTPMLHRLFAFGQSLNVPMLYVVCPMGEGKAPPEMRGSLIPMLDAVRAVANDFPLVHFLSPNFRFYPDTTAFDNAHMIGDGPERNSKEIAAGAVQLLREIKN
jgi:hypothetical protein